MECELQDLCSLKQLLFTYPSLHNVFLELTRSCNLRCRHCGSSCPSENNRQMLHMADVQPVIDRITEMTDPRFTMFSITGGEPLLNPEWEAIGSYINRKGFGWGMTSNGTLIDDDMVQRLAAAGMRTISISLDGLKDTHELLRGVEGCYEKAIAAIRRLKKSNRFRCVQVITVVSPENISQMEKLYQVLLDLKVDSWKITGVEPVGEARRHPELQLSRQAYIQLFHFIQEKRQTAPFEVTYGCSHFLPLTYDNTVRRAHFLCGAGTLIASITCEGDIVACLDIDAREQTKQGNIKQDDFWDVWTNRFQMFRQRRTLDNAICGPCNYKDFCLGDAWHTWDFQKNQPDICLFRLLSKWEV